MKNYTFPLFLLLLVLGGCANDPTEIPKLTCNQPDFMVNKTVENIQQTAAEIVAQYPYDDVIEAYVVSSDENGNFFKTISLQTLATETTPAVGCSVPVDATNLYVDYRIGNKVYIKLKNQYTDLYYGGLRIGSLYVNAYNQGGVGRISQNDYKKVLNTSCTNVKEEQLVHAIDLAEINDSHLNTLIELSDVQFTEAAISRHYYEETNDVGGATNWNLVDKKGNQLIFRTSTYADFSKNIVPEGSGKVRGVLTKYASDYQLIARKESDVQMSETRNIPFFVEDFQSVSDGTNLSLPGWSNIIEAGAIVWKGGITSTNGYAEFAITGTKVASNIVWLISPKIDMDTHTNERLSFRTAQHHLDVDSPLNTLKVYVSTNFDGANIKTATWIPISARIPTQTTPWYEFIGSGAIDLSGYSGKINIAFKYIGSGKNLTLDGAFQLDDVQIYGD
ncbi:putative lipoprotein [Flavobacterium daejeonense]|nr:putative lipoprotein [Flavobacterium daejeonense]